MDTPLIAAATMHPDLPQARTDFDAAFHEFCPKSKMSTPAIALLEEIFDKAVRHALNANPTMKWGERKAFVLGRVHEMAAYARDFSAGGKVTDGHLERAKRHVVEYWRPRCEKYLHRNSNEIRLVFCENV
jgi:hypothetical protein